MTPNIGLKDRGKGVRGKGTCRFIRNDFENVPELKVSKIMEKYRHLGNALEKKKVTPRALHSRAKKKVVNLMDLVIVEIRFLSDQYSNLPLVEHCDKLLF